MNLSADSAHNVAQERFKYLLEDYIETHDGPSIGFGIHTMDSIAAKDYSFTISYNNMLCNFLSIF